MQPDKGHYRAYKEVNFRPDSLVLIDAAKAILVEYESKGYTLTLRGLHYKMVTRHKDFYANTPRMYDRLGKVISEARMAGRISWTSMEDMTRNIMGYETFEHPSQAIAGVRADYKRDLWSNQKFRPLVMFEKQALEGVVGPVCQKFRVDYFGCRGYTSQSAQWRLGQRFARSIQKGQIPIVFHLGDHDPSGIDMTRDNRERLAMFAGVQVTVVRLALNIEQVEELDLPPDPAKLDDPRAAEYIQKFGNHSWELDALEPELLADIISKQLYKLRDEELWSEALAQEAEDKDSLDLAIERMGGMDQ